MALTDQLRQLIESATLNPDLAEYLDREELGDAELFDQLFRRRAVFDHAERRWYLWNGSLWIADEKGAILTFVGNEVAAEYLGAAETERRNGNTDLSDRFIKRAKLLRHLRRIRNVLELASHLEEIALDGKEWDTASMLLPVSNGVIDLSSGLLRSGLPTDFVRACAPTEWRGLESAAPQWERLLEEIFAGDAETTDFMQRLFGYSITGNVQEQVLPILWGQGANGKSTLMDVVSAVLGEQFCFTTQADSLMDLREADGNAARPFVHALRNKRLVWASESKEGRRLNTGLVKQLTGDRNITARTLYREPTTFRQTHKIFLITNHCPRLPDGDDFALWRRILRVPFNERFVDNPKGPHEHPQDRQLVERLRSEAPGILAWLVRGCLAWQSQGLNPPPSVLESTDTYRKDEDLIGQFVCDRLLVRDGNETPAGSLYKEYSGWCEESGTRPLSSRSFGQSMTQRFGPAVPKWVAGRTERTYKGVGLAAEKASVHITELTQAPDDSR